MDSQQILKALKQERSRLQTAIDILEPRSDGRKHKPLNGRRRRRKLSAAAKQRISDAMKQRWENVKKAGRNSL